MFGHIDLDDDHSDHCGGVWFVVQLGMCSQRLVACSVCAAPSGDVGVVGRLLWWEGDDGAPPAPVIHSMGDFPLEQHRDDTLRSAFHQVIRIDGHTVCPDAALTYLHFVLIKDGL